MPVKPLRVPPLAVTSSTLKSVELSERAKLIAAVSRNVSDVSPLVMAMVGAAVSTAMVTEASPVLALPAASVKAPAATETTPSAVLSAVGVKVAVYAAPVPANPLRDPPLALTSSTVKSVEATDRLKLMAAVSPMLSNVSSLVMAMVGGAVFTSNVMLGSPVFVLPAKSLKVSAATETTPFVVLFAVGVNVAV